MTRDDDIIRMAREAGWSGIYTQWISGTEHKTLPIPVTMEELSRFAALVAAQERKSYEHTLALQQRSYEREIKIEVEAEREACAKVCEDMEEDFGKHAYAFAIRARGQA